MNAERMHACVAIRNMRCIVYIYTLLLCMYCIFFYIKLIKEARSLFNKRH